MRTISDNKRSYRSYFTHDGKPYERTGKTQKEADQKAALYKAQLERGEIGISSNMSVSRWADEWLETYKEPVVGDKQYHDIKLTIDKLIKPPIGAMQLKSVKDIHLQKILNERKGKSLSNIRKLYQIMDSMFERASISKLITSNPAAHLEIPAAVNGTNRSITFQERRHILELAETHHAGLWIKTLLYTGIRPGESRALEWRHIDFEKKLLKYAEIVP